MTQKIVRKQRHYIIFTQKVKNKNNLNSKFLKSFNQMKTLLELNSSEYSKSFTISLQCCHLLNCCNMQNIGLRNSFGFESLIVYHFWQYLVKKKWLLAYSKKWYILNFIGSFSKMNKLHIFFPWETQISLMKCPLLLNFR